MIFLFGRPVPLPWLVAVGLVVVAVLALLIVLLVRALRRGGAPADVVQPPESGRRVERPALEVRPHPATAGHQVPQAPGNEPRHDSSAVPALAMLDEMATVPLPRPARDADPNPSTDPLPVLASTALASTAPDESRSSPRHAR